MSKADIFTLFFNSQVDEKTPDIIISRGSCKWGGEEGFPPSPCYMVREDLRAFNQCNDEELRILTPPNKGPITEAIPQQAPRKPAYLPRLSQGQRDEVELRR